MSEIKNFSKKESNKIPLFKDNIFNSILFIDLDSTYDSSINDSNEEESKNSEAIDDNIKDESFLNKDLIEELDSPESDMIKFYNSVNNNKATSTLKNNGYKFIPKKYRNDANNNCKDKYSHNNFEYNINNNKSYKYRIKNKKERKDDWICKYCLNLNFAFRKKCNICKAPRINEYIKNYK